RPRSPRRVRPGDQENGKERERVRRPGENRRQHGGNDERVPCGNEAGREAGGRQVVHPLHCLLSGCLPACRCPRPHGWPNRTLSCSSCTTSRGPPARLSCPRRACTPRRSGFSLRPGKIRSGPSGPAASAEDNVRLLAWAGTPAVILLVSHFTGGRPSL